MSEPVSIAERYGKATVASDLRHRETSCPTDVLAAMAWSDRKIGTLLYRVVVTNDRHSYPPLLEAWTEYIERLASRKDWKVGGAAMVACVVSTRQGDSMVVERGPAYVARESLHHYVFDVCPACLGRRYKTVADQPQALSDDLCEVCDGSGKTQVRTKDKRYKPHVQEALSILQERFTEAGWRAMDRLRRQMP